MTPTSSLAKVTRRYLTGPRPQKQSLNPHINAISRSVLVDGTEHVISYTGTSQYNRDGTGASACGLAALNFARIVFSMEQGGLQDTTLLQAVLDRTCVEETTAICASWPGNRHLEVEEICRIPLFEKTLELMTTKYGHPGVSEFKSLLTELSNLDSSAVVIITRPPEIIACLKLRVATRNVFIIFDSHPRPSYPNGAGMTVSPSIEGTARRLTELLPTVDLPDISQWEAQLLSNYSGHIFVSNDFEMSTSTLWQAVLESSLAQLSIQAEVAELRSQNESLKGEQQRLKREIKEAGQGRQSSTPSSSKESTSTLNPFISTLSLFASALLLLPSYLLCLPSILLALIPIPPARGQVALGHLDKPPTPPSDYDESILEAMRLQNEFDNEDRMLSAQRAELAHPGKPPTLPSDRDDSLLEAMRLQNEFDNEDRMLSAQRAELAHPGKPPTLPSDRDDTLLEAMRLQNEFDNEDRMFSELVHAGESLIPPSDRDDSILEAMRLQNEFDKEDRALSAQRAELAKSAQRSFECGICMEELPEDSVARPDPCGHNFCRECLRGHVTARVNERRFPILCPTCTAGKGKGKEATGEVSQSLAQDLGLTDEQYRIWTEVEMVSFSILLNCRKCQRTMFVAKDEHENAKTITCPLPDCNHTWCKQCQQSIDPNGPKHSCGDGTLELDRLIKQQGWKYCPKCKTPIQKISGCDHMTCATPGCNTDFCYVCGGDMANGGCKCR